MLQWTVDGGWWNQPRESALGHLRAYVDSPAPRHTFRDLPINFYIIETSLSTPRMNLVHDNIISTNRHTA